MSIRSIIEIDEERCNGCGQCVTACAEGAIQLVNRKAKLISDQYCDGLGACIGTCPTGALKIIQREAEPFNEEKVPIRSHRHSPVQEDDHLSHIHSSRCPGVRMIQLSPKNNITSSKEEREIPSLLQNWPIQLHLISPHAPYLQHADLLLAADCTAFAMGTFHPSLLKGRILMIACPKLDDTSPYLEKLVTILKQNFPRSLTVIHMEVPCCNGLYTLAQHALSQSGTETPLHRIVLGLDGRVQFQD